MCKYNAVILLLAGLVAGSVAVQSSLSTRKDCTPNTFSCGNNCTAVTFCSESLEVVVVETCPANTRCNSETATCTADAKCYPPPDENEFHCHAFGSLPDPYNCHKYHFCYNDSVSPDLVDLKFDCVGEAAYDPLTTMCEYSATDRVCTEGPIPECKDPGQQGAQVENPNIYYVCVQQNDTSLPPWLFRCAPGMIFDDGRCVAKPDETTTTTVQTSSFQTLTSTTAPTSTSTVDTTVTDTTSTTTEELTTQEETTVEELTTQEETTVEELTTQEGTTVE